MFAEAMRGDSRYGSVRQAWQAFAASPARVSRRRAATPFIAVTPAIPRSMRDRRAIKSRKSLNVARAVSRLPDVCPRPPLRCSRRHATRGA